MTCAMRYALPWEIETYLYWACVGYYMPIQCAIILATTHTTFDVSRVKPKLVLHIVGGEVFILQSLVRGSWMSCLPILTLTLNKVLALACIVQNPLAELYENLGMHQWKKWQLVSNIKVMCFTQCFLWFKDSSMHAFLALVLGRGIVWSTLLMDWFTLLAGRRMEMISE